MHAAVRFAMVVVAGSVGAVGSGSLHAGDWPAFRGAAGGVGEAVSVPMPLTPEAIAWKVKLPGLGASSPIVVGDKIFVTCYAGYGTTLSRGFGKGGFGKGGFGKGAPGGFGKGAPGKGGVGFGKDEGDQKKLRLLLVCLKQQNGETLWQKEIEPKLPESPWTNFIREHGYASSTPASDGERVYVFFGKTGVLAFDLEGKRLWQADVGDGVHIWGSAASPVVHGDLVIVNAAIESGSLVALDKLTGKERWRVKGLTTSWTTPVVATVAKGENAGKHEIVLSVPGKIVGYDPADGKELWHCEGIGRAQGGYTISTPVVRDGVVYVIGGGGQSGPPTALAVRAGGRGDVTESHVVWKQRGGTSTASPVLSGDHLCWVAGAAVCLHAADGKQAYEERVYDSRSEYVSAVAAGDKIFALTRFDGLFVLAGGGTFDKLAHLEFKGDDSVFNASPALADGRIYVRSNEYLYCIGKK